jgi:hypothetical protein
MKTPFPKYDAALVADIEHHLSIDRATEPDGFGAEPVPGMPGLLFTTHKGRWGTPAQGRRECSRPMFQIFGDGIGSAMRQSVTPCPDCDDWARTSRCAEHHELTWNAKTRRWDGRSPEGEEPPTPRPLPLARYSSSGTLNQSAASTLASLYEQMTRALDQHITERAATSEPPAVQVDGETLTGPSSFVFQFEEGTADGV